jgi:hypothetical protein
MSDDYRRRAIAIEAAIRGKVPVVRIHVRQACPPLNALVVRLRSTLGTVSQKAVVSPIIQLIASASCLHGQLPIRSRPTTSENPHALTSAKDELHCMPTSIRPGKPAEHANSESFDARRLQLGSHAAPCDHWLLTDFGNRFRMYQMYSGRLSLGTHCRTALSVAFACSANSSLSSL